MRKEKSSNSFNENKIIKICDLEYTVNLIGKRWSLIILCRLENGKMRYSEIYKSIENITERMLVLRLKELEKKKLVKRIYFKEHPKLVEYELTDYGILLSKIFVELRNFGQIHKQLINFQL